MKTIKPFSSETVDFFTSEANQIHALCDRVNVPRELQGVALSMSQRVAVMEGVCAGLISRVAGKPPALLH